MMTLVAVLLAQEFQVPETTRGENGWEEYVRPTTYDREKAKDLAPGFDSAEAAVVHFFASRIRGDERWKEALPPKDKWPKDLQSRLDKLEKWTFRKMTLTARKKIEDGTFVIRVQLDVQVGRESGGSKENIAVEKIDGKWRVTRPPS